MSSEYVQDAGQPNVFAPPQHDSSNHGHIDVAQPPPAPAPAKQPDSPPARDQRQLPAQELIKPPKDVPAAVDTSTTIPETTILSHAPGWTIFQNVYMSNGTMYIVTSRPSSFPDISLITSTGLPAENTPENMDELQGYDYVEVYGRYHARLVHFHYVKSTMELNELHYEALSDPVSLFIRRLFDRAGAPWEGETHDLKALLVEATERWAELAGPDVPCPVEFDPDDVSKTKAFSELLRLSDENFAGCQAIVGFETETWVPNEHYERSKALAELLKLAVLKEIPAGEARDKAEANWFLDDMNEDDYM
ncbi:hypothetical protein NUW54_g13235 [Trametes sanguinea]|uniref:Uncharacterized protein n=1 Tax=Trametes sanguinea TaxID=158606 RepID=A0ACC1MNH2_9APHY|nr:hypothetical protein NUW54_g13235 [Trametes sanguinea]